MDFIVNTIILPGKINREAVIGFINKYHEQENGNRTLITPYIYNSFSKLGTIFSYSTENNKITGSIFSILLTLNTGKSSYTTYLCLNPDYRSKQYAPSLIESNINFGSKYLNVCHGYYLGIKSRKKGCLINSWYRILDINKMKDTGFRMVEDNVAKIKYKVSMPKNTYVKEGLHVDNVTDSLCLIHWSPDKKELDRFKTHLNFYTIYQNDKPTGVFILFPLECIVGRTNAKVSMGMLTYFYSFSGNDNNNLRAVFSTAKDKGYSSLYGYLLGDLSKDVIIETGCHITTLNFYLDFYNHPYDKIYPESINVPIF